MPEEEVRYHMLRPRQAVERRKACPVAYIPLGTLEWHGPHNPLGADTLQAEDLAILCARKGGGLAFPGLSYADNRLQCLVDATATDRTDIAREMELPPSNFDPEAFPFTVTEQSLDYQRLLLHILAEAETLGFEVAVFVAGHAPLVDMARSACLLSNQRTRSRKQGILAWAVFDSGIAKRKYPGLGDHGAGWETSHLLATRPETVDLSVLPPKGAPIVHCEGAIPPQDATAAFGRETFDYVAGIVVKEARHRLEHKRFYLAHGQAFVERKWEEDGALGDGVGGRT
ncbi:MAG: creatininase family protein [Planctomycetota bacterium]